ncbi:hypothetical protein L195_g064582, partial [Trifolium pratense]
MEEAPSMDETPSMASTDPQIPDSLRS